MPTHSPPLNILIVGGGICGPTLALLLQRTNPTHTITILEHNPILRTGGQQIDVHAQAVPIMKALDLLDTIRTYCVRESGFEIIDRQGKSLMQFGVVGADEESKPGELQFTNEYEFMRGDFVRMMYEISLKERKEFDERGFTKGSLTYIFGKSVTALTHVTSPKRGTRVTYSTNETATFDLVVAADGLRSRTRRLAFGESTSEAAFKPLNVHAAFYNVPRLPTENSLARVYVAPDNRVIMTRTGDRPVTQVIHFLLKNDEERARRMAAAYKKPVEEQKAVWSDAFRDAGWQSPRFMRGMQEVEDFYAVELGQVKMPGQQLYRNRVALLGDAGYCPSPYTGMGTTLSVIGAYVLAGELARCGGDVEAGLEAYQEEMKRPVEESQILRLVEVQKYLPQSKWGVWVLGWVIWIVATLRVDKMSAWLGGLLPEDGEKRWELPEYPEMDLRAPEMR